MSSSQLDVVTFHSNGDRSLQQIHRHDQALILALAHEDPLDSIKGSAANSNAFPDGDKGMREAWNLLTNGFPEAFNLLIGNRSAMSFISQRNPARQASAAPSSAPRWSEPRARRRSN